MIITVTPNTGIDRVLFVSGFEWGRRVPVERAAVAMGGKATDVSMILRSLGVPTLALGFAAGDAARLMDKMLRQAGAKTDWTYVSGETRVNHVLVDTASHRQSTLVTDSLYLDDPEAAVGDLKAKLLAAAPGNVAVLAGSLPKGCPPGLYADLVASANRAGAITLLDCIAAPLRCGLSARPFLIKPNLHEFQELVGKPVSSEADILREASALLRGGPRHVVVSLGDMGALAVSESESCRVRPLSVEVVNAAGAGDGMVAGLAMAFSEGRPLAEGLRLATAIATAVLITPGTAECYREDVERFLPQVVVERIKKECVQ
ncbi:MAG: 1-phosphofructokinase family hexose kinase [Armatimonadetes bacterium]|nr:1-phosphofructokinase family hexose kinase [Armatimonadota bacterium]